MEKVGDNNTPIRTKGGAVRIPADRVGSVSHSVPVAVIPSASHGSGVPLSVASLGLSVGSAVRLACLASPAVSLSPFGLSVCVGLDVSIYGIIRLSSIKLHSMYLWVVGVAWG